MGGMVLHVYEPGKWKEILTESKENNQAVPVLKLMPMLLINCVLSVLKEGTGMINPERRTIKEKVFREF